jgi:hypothetical protein
MNCSWLTLLLLECLLLCVKLMYHFGFQECIAKDAEGFQKFWQTLQLSSSGLSPWGFQKPVCIYIYIYMAADNEFY